MTYHPDSPISFDDILDEVGQFTYRGTLSGSAEGSIGTKATTGATRLTTGIGGTVLGAATTPIVRSPLPRVGSDPYSTVLQLWNELHDTAKHNAARKVTSDWRVWMLPVPDSKLTAINVEQLKKGTNTRRTDDPHGRNGWWSGWQIYVPPALLQVYYNATKKRAIKRRMSGKQVENLLGQLLEENKEFTGRTRSQAQAEIDASRPKTPIRKVVGDTPSPLLGGRLAGRLQLKPRVDMVELEPPLTPTRAQWEQRMLDARYPFRVDFPQSVRERLKKIVEMLELAKIQREATSEHNVISAQAQYRRTVLDALHEADKVCPGQGPAVIRVIMERAPRRRRRRRRNPAAHAHRVRLPSGETIMTEFDYIAENPCYTPDDDELGVDPFTIAALAAPVVAGALGGKGDKGAAPPAIPDLGGLMGAIVDADQIKAIVANLLSTIPPPVKDQVLEVIQSVQAQGGSLKAAENALVKNIEKQFLPAVGKALEALKLAQTQREATSEHNTLALQAKRWDRLMASQRSVSKNQKKLDARLQSLQATVDDVLANNKILPRRAVKLAGGDRTLDVLSGRR